MALDLGGILIHRTYGARLGDDYSLKEFVATRNDKAGPPFDPRRESAAKR